MYYLGVDVGSSSIKIALVQKSTGNSVGVVQEPSEEMHMLSLKKGWAEQDPEDWWSYVCNGIDRIKKAHGILGKDIVGVGIAYQMHGLVLVDSKGNSLRKAIIWCDSRAIEIGNRAYEEIGKEKCDTRLLNAPGNFTASKLAWVKKNESDIYKEVHKFMLPGDYIAFRLSNSVNT
ncbi:MAG: carbohydrate kinase, partial [Flavobacteriaceae bacterium]|nr:carbohydrate kinase [Flavobacteriaceae bacterium]